MVQLLRRKNFYFLSVETDLKINNKPSGVTSGLLWFVFSMNLFCGILIRVRGEGERQIFFILRGRLETRETSGL